MINRIKHQLRIHRNYDLPKLSGERRICESVCLKQSLLTILFLLLSSNLIYGEMIASSPHVLKKRNYSIIEKLIKQRSEYAGSQACMECHNDIFDEWKLTPHARMMRKPSELDEKDVVPFKELNYPEDKIISVLGSHYVHRFVVEASGTYVVLPKIWDIHQKKWVDSNDKNWTKRYWLKQCAGCHTTGFNPKNDTFIETGVGCEACHGPGAEHIKRKSPDYITSIKKMAPKYQEMICMSCHTSGMDESGEHFFAAGYKPGDNLEDFYSGLTPKPGQTQENFYGDETLEDRERQWKFLKSRLFLASGLTCDYCQNFREYKTTDGSEYLTYDQYCLTCHTDKTDHPEESPGTNCSVCHQPNVHLSNKLSIHDHKFRFKD
jgi:hypothetical protein